MRVLLFLLFGLHVSLMALELSDAQKNYLENKGVITMCVDPDWEPFETINAKSEHVGISADLIALVAQRLGVRIELLPTKTWKESLEASQSKRCDIMSLVNQSPKRDQWLIYTDPILEDPAMLIAREENEHISDLSQLHGHTIALIKDSKMLEHIETYYPELTIIPVVSEAEAFSLVERKKADVTLRPLIIAAYTIKKENFLNLKIVGTAPELDNKLRIGVNKDAPELREILNIGVQSITSEEREQIVNKYVVLTIKTHAKSYTWLLYGLFFLALITAAILYVNYQLRQKIDKEVRKNLEQSKKAALGSLMATISHQWRESLMKISYINLGLRVSIAKHETISEDFLDKSTQEIEKTIDFMSETMKNFLDYYKPTTNIQEFEVHDSIKAVINIMDTRIKNLNLEIIFTVISNVHLKGIRNEWMHVWMNILSNTLNIAQYRSIAHPCIIITLDEASIQFQDNCGGIEPAILESIAHDTHSGLGIKMCKEILKKYGKALHVKNAKEGALFGIKPIDV